MAYRAGAGAPRNIAVVGAGISGLGAAHLLSAQHRVTLIEREPRLGGHARTVVAGKRGDQPVDVGFIVFNYATYPHLTALFDRLDVPVAKSNMSFGASFEGGRIEYGLETTDKIFAQRSNLMRPAFLRMVRDIVKFNKHAIDVVGDDREMTVAELLDRLGTGPWFRDRYLYPFSGAIWSTPTTGVGAFPAWSMMNFFRNHALLSRDNHEWFTVAGGSVEYVTRVERALRDAGVEIRAGTPVAGIRRTAGSVELRVEGGDWERFDEVVLATHSDVSLALLQDATPDEARCLGAIRYQPNEVVLHSDASLMPKRRKCWASWNYTEIPGKSSDRIDLTYWMNSLQPIPEDDPLFVTLNNTRLIREDLIHHQTTFEHPFYDGPALAAQEEMRALNGRNATWFCGAWMRNGFHEDGLSSAVDVAEAIAARDADPVAAQ